MLCFDIKKQSKAFKMYDAITSKHGVITTHTEKVKRLVLLYGVSLKLLKDNQYLLI